jgi:ORF6N domain
LLLNEDLADLHGVEMKRLVEQVKRNVERFPANFMFQLDETEAAALRSQIATSKSGRGGRRYSSYVYAALEERLRELERETTARFGEHDEQLDQIFKTLRQLISPPARPKRPVGFRPPRTTGRGAAMERLDSITAPLVQIPSG